MSFKNIISNKSFFSNPNRGLPPLRTLTELCEELDVSKGKLVSALREDGAPKPIQKVASRTGHKTWYEPIAFKKWWRARADQGKHLKNICSG